MAMRIQMVAGFLVLAMMARAQWSQTNGPLGGEAADKVIISGGNFLALAEDNELYHSSDQGQSWRRVCVGFYGLGAFVNSGDYLFAGTDNGVIRSLDHGLTWAPSGHGIPQGSAIHALAVHGSRVYAATNSRIYYSLDGGASWMATSPITQAHSPILTLVVSGDLMFVGNTLDGIIRSTNHGATWQLSNNGLGDPEICDLAVSGDRFIATTVGGGVFVSTNGGSSWTAINAGLEEFVCGVLVPSGDDVLLGTQAGLYRLHENESVWLEIPIVHQQSLLAVDLAVDGSAILVATGWSTSVSHDIYNLYHSENQGVNWSGLPGAPCTEILSLAVQNDTVFACDRDGLFKSENAGATWFPTDQGIPFWYNRQVLAADENHVFLGTSDGLYRSDNAGEDWLWVLQDHSITSLGIQGNIVLAGTEASGVYASANQGTTWVSANAGLPPGAINALHMNEDQFLVAVSGSGIYRSLDEGNTWSSLSDNLAGRSVQALHATGSRLYAGTYEEGGGVFLSEDNGNSWSQRLEGFQVNAFVEWGSSVLAGSYQGIFYSPDQGMTWQEAREGLYHPVQALANHGPVVYAGTHGGGVYSNTTLLTGLTQIPSGVFPLQVYPNPAGSILWLALPERSEGGDFEVIDAGGRLNVAGSFRNRIERVDIRELPPGAYVIRYLDGSAMYIGRFIKY